MIPVKKTLKFHQLFYCFILVVCGQAAYAQVPVVNFSADAFSGCSPFKVNFSDKSSGGPVSWLWDLGNGSISTKKDPSAIYISPGVYVVKLTVTNASGSSTQTGSITVYENPTPKFLTDKNAGCAPVQVQFTDNSIGGNGSSNSKWMWDFGNGAQSTLQNPTIKYTIPGIFTVVLKVTNDKGCSTVLTEEKLITVTQGVTLGFSNKVTDACKAPFPIKFTNTSTGSGTVKYFWNFGDGNTATDKNPSNTYAASGNYPVILIGSNGAGCADTLIKELIVAETKTDFKVNDTVCINNPTSFANASNPAPVSSIWEFADGSTVTSLNAVKTFLTPGTYPIKLTNTYSACVGTIEKNIIVENSPKAFFSASSQGRCSPGLEVAFDNLSIDAVTYLWNFGDSSQPLLTNSKTASHTYTFNGAFKVSLTAFNNSGCSNTYTLPDPIIIGPPVVKIKNLPSLGCVPMVISPYADVSPSTNITGYEWNFGDGTVKTGINPTHTYTNKGKYTVKLSITLSDGCTATTSDSISVGSHSTLAFSADPRNICAIDTVYFTNTSQPANALYTWTFGDGGKSSDYTPTYTYSDTGWFKVKLESNNNGCIDSIFSEEKYIYIKAPIARFSYSPNCNIGYQYQFNDESLFDAGSEAKRTWKWVFPDGTVSTNATPPIYTFPGPGVYTVSLTISNGNCIHIKTGEVRIFNKAAGFSFDSNKNCKPAIVSFQAESHNLQNVKSFRWEMDGFDTTTVSPVLNHTFSDAGIYSLKLTTTDVTGCIDSVRKPILISGPKASFSRIKLDDCKKLTATFSDSSESFGTNNIVSWTWDFGDSVKEEKFDAAPIAHVYKDTGIYMVKLLVTDAVGCTDIVAAKDSARIKEIVADWTATDKACLGFPISFQNTSRGNYTSFSWNFGDGSTGPVQNEGTYNYKDTGYYDLKLIINDALGCKDSMVRKQYVHIARPNAAFTIKDSISFCPPFEVAFTNTSDFFSSVEWAIDEERSTDIHYRKLFTKPGKYDVNLTVKSPDKNCTSTASKTITVFRKEDALIEYDPLQACLPGLVNLSAFDKLASARFFWDFGDGNISDTSANSITHTYTDLGSFIPKIILTEDNGCVITIAGIKPIIIKGAKAKFDVNNRFFCDSGYVTIADSTTYSDPITKYIWDFGDGTVSNLPVPPIHKYSTAGSYPILLIVETEAGCIDSSRLKAPVTIANSPQFSIHGDSVICINERLLHSAILERQDSSSLKWSWLFPNGKNASVQKPSVQQYTVAGSFQIKTVAVNASGCADTAIKKIIVHPLPNVKLPPVLHTKVGESVFLDAKYSDTMVKYIWTPAISLSCNNCPQPVASPKFNTDYSVAFTDSNGCKNTGEIKVIVLCQGITVFLPNTFSPNDDGSNDKFYVRGKGLDRVKSLRIFNRWGEVVFEEKDFPVNNEQHGWDGKFKGLKPHPDVYVYQVEVYCANGELMIFSGNVALIQ